MSVVNDHPFHVAFRNITLFSLVTVPAELVIGFVLAYLLREPFRGRGLVRAALLIPWLVSPMANGVMWHFLSNSERGLLNFCLAWLDLTALPSPLGMKGWALPSLRPLLLTVALLFTGDALGTFDSVLILTGGGPGSATLTPALYSYQQAFQNHLWPIGTTSAWLIVASVLLVGLVYVRSVRTE